MLKRAAANRVIVLASIFLLVGITVVSLPYAQEDKEIRNKWKYYKTPELSGAEISNLALQAARQPQQYITDTNGRINDFSRKLEDYVSLWLEGKAKAEFPKGFFSEWIDHEKTHDWRLIKPDEINPDEQWYIAPAYDPVKELHQFSPDPSGTYLRILFLAPLDSKLLIEGDFPHCRFMDYQITLPLDPLHPQEGMCEVPLVDVDIKPDPGHVNPFRVGADRNAVKRHYHIEFELKAGNAVKLNPEAMIPPEYRAPGKTRVGGPFQLTSFYSGNVLVPAILWLRYYGPDKSAGPLGGVPLPKAALQLASGAKFWITCDKSLVVKLETSPVPRIPETPPQEPYSFTGPSLGWFKMFDIMFAHMEARGYYTSEPWGKGDLEQTRKKIRQSFRLLFNRGSEATPPGNYETGPTCNNYCSYLIRPMNLGRNKVIVLTGKLPTFPHTRNGEPTMTKGGVRFFSVTHQLSTNSEHNKGHHGTPYGVLVDDEIVTNENNDYVIVYSRKRDRPANARPEFGVTWQDWGEPASQGFVLRWVSVMPDWYLLQYAPDQNNIPWRVGAWSEDTYDKSLVGRNEPGVMGPYHPVIHYMTKEEFEALGDRRLSPKEIPLWKASNGTAGGQEGEDLQQKLTELRQAFNDLAQARQAGNRQGVAASSRRIYAIWDDLPERARQEIEKEWPGITEKIAKMRT